MIRIATVGFLASVIVFGGLFSPVYADTTAQEVFICSLRDGKTMDDLMKVVDQWKPIIAKMKGGESYEATILTPIAANDLGNVIWVGRSPNMAVMGGLTDEYEQSKAGQDIAAKFQAVIDCASRSVWRATQVK